MASFFYQIRSKSPVGLYMPKSVCMKENFEYKKTVTSADRLIRNYNSAKCGLGLHSSWLLL